MISHYLERKHERNGEKHRQTSDREKEEGIIKLGMKTENEGEREKKRAGNALSCTTVRVEETVLTSRTVGSVLIIFCLGVVRTRFILGLLNEVG